MSGEPRNEGTAETAGLVECPRCRESISGNATICPRCRTSTLVDLLVEQAVSDAKLRYRASRFVFSLKPGSSLTSLQAALSVSGGRVLSAVTPGIAAKSAEGLEALGI
jgi:hypothetical protein